MAKLNGGGGGGGVTPVINAGTGIQVTGTSPTWTITNTKPSLWIGSVGTSTFTMLPSGGININGQTVGDRPLIAISTNPANIFIANQPGIIAIGDYLQVQSGYFLVMGYNNLTGSVNYGILIGAGNANQSNSSYQLGNYNDIRQGHAFVHGDGNGMALEFAERYNTIFGYGNHIVAGNNNSNFLLGAYHAINGTAKNFNFAMGKYHTVGSSYGSVFGLEGKSSMYGQEVRSSGKITTIGDAQTSRLVARVTTLDDIAVEIALDGASAYLVTEDNKAYAFEATVIAKDTGSTDHAMWTLKWATVRGTGVGTVTVDGLAKTAIFKSQPSWDITVTADIVNGRPAIMVTGALYTTIDWVAKIEMTEVA